MNAYPNGHRRLLTPLALIAVGLLALAGCGGDDETTTSSTTAGVSGATGEQGSTGAPSSLTSEDEEAISETIKGWLTEGGCERMTDKFLEDQTFVSNPDEACETFESSFSEPSYSADDVIVDQFSGDSEKAKAVVSDDFSNIESTYTLVNEDGTWKIDAAGF